MGIFEKFKYWITEAGETSPTSQRPELDEILQKISVYKRSAWMPLVEEEKGLILVSKIGGKPYIPIEEEHPKCPNCGEDMSLFLQLRPHDSPKNSDLDLDPDKLIQLFYCTNKVPHCEVDCEAWVPFSKSVLARTVLIPTIHSEPASVASTSRVFEEKIIVDWIEIEDYPDWQEMQIGDAKLSATEVEVLETSETGTPRAADKLGGWPYWVQGVEYPLCPDCGIQMQMIFQLDSNHHLDYMFGDAGIGHLHQCRIHKNNLAFGWAAY